MYILIAIALVVVGFVIIMVAGFNKGASLALGTKAEAYSIDNNLITHKVVLSQDFYLGSRESAPRLETMGEVASNKVIQMSGYDKQPPLITMEEIRSLPPVFTERK